MIIQTNGKYVNVMTGIVEKVDFRDRLDIFTEKTNGVVTSVKSGYTYTTYIKFYDSRGFISLDSSFPLNIAEGDAISVWDNLNSYFYYNYSNGQAVKSSQLSYTGLLAILLFLLFVGGMSSKYILAVIFIVLLAIAFVVGFFFIKRVEKKAKNVIMSNISIAKSLGKIIHNMNIYDLEDIYENSPYKDKNDIYEKFPHLKSLRKRR